METNGFDMVYFNFTLQCQHFDIFLFYQWNILLRGMVFLVTGVDISVKFNLLTDTDILTTFATLYTLKNTFRIAI